MWSKITYDHRDASVPLSFSSGFPAAFLAAGQSLEFAIFIRKEPGGRSSTLYFTPAAAAFAASNQAATPCDKPNGDGIALYAGERASLALFFPEQ